MCWQTQITLFACFFDTAWHWVLRKEMRIVTCLMMPGTVESALSEPVQWAELSEKNRLAEMNQSSFASLQRRLSRIRQSRASRSSVPLFLHPDWPVICLAIGRTGVSLSVHLYMVITGRFALVLLEVPLSVPPDWPVGGASSQRILRSGSSKCWIVIVIISSIIFVGHSLFTSRIWKGKSVYAVAWFADVRMIY